jgi:hypothetical protein
MIDLYHVPLPVIFVVGPRADLGLSEIGWRLGQRGSGQSSNNFPTLESAVAGRCWR